LLKLWWWVETLLQDFQVFPFFKTWNIPWLPMKQA
jgi:hypothetical protein